MRRENVFHHHVWQQHQTTPKHKRGCLSQRGVAAACLQRREQTRAWVSTGVESNNTSQQKVGIGAKERMAQEREEDDDDGGGEGFWSSCEDNRWRKQQLENISFGGSWVTRTCINLRPTDRQAYDCMLVKEPWGVTWWSEEVQGPRNSKTLKRRNKKKIKTWNKQNLEQDQGPF